jgi:F-type H+-transporting ATPase subunit b
MVSIEINASLLWQMANFIVLVIALNFLLYRPIRGILRKRAERMAALKGEITASREGLRSKQEELERQLAEARRQGVAVTEEMKAEGRARERELIEAATREMEETVAKVRAEIQQELEKARAELRDQVQSFGVELAQKILGRSIQ